MCGRLACGLQRDEICKSCCYQKPGSNTFTTPKWKNFDNYGKTYKPSYNLCPTDVAPVLISGKHFKSNRRVIAPMIFGVIPKWSKGVESKYFTINCRIETVVVSKLYGNLLKKGQRCVVICNGFYEWQKQSSSKKPYFIHPKQPDKVIMDDPNTWNLDFNPEEGYSGLKLLRLAGLFEINLSTELEESTLSFTIITTEANSEMSWLHSRMPAVLETEEQLDAWLDYEKVDSDSALRFLSNKTSFMFVPVSNLVNKTNNKDISCIKQEKETKKKDASGSFLRNWLQKNEESHVCKKMKKEDS